MAPSENMHILPPSTQRVYPGVQFAEFYNGDVMLDFTIFPYIGRYESKVRASDIGLTKRRFLPVPTTSAMAESRKYESERAPWRWYKIPIFKLMVQNPVTDNADGRVRTGCTLALQQAH